MITILLVGAVGFAACGDDGSSVDADVGAIDAPPGTIDGAADRVDAAGTGASCGGFAGDVCRQELYCDYEVDDCGGADGIGVCREMPEDCTAEVSPVCACDGTVYSNECEANRAGYDVSALAPCTPPLDTFRCGFRFCAHATEYCLQIVSDVGGVPDEFECVGIPGNCGNNPDCGCLRNENCGEFCEQHPDGNLQLTCPGG